MEQKNWHVVRQTVGYHRYDTAAELELLNRIWALQGQLTNHFGPQQKLVQKIRTGAKINKKYDRPATPYQRVLTDEGTVQKGVKAKRLDWGVFVPYIRMHPLPRITDMTTDAPLTETAVLPIEECWDWLRGDSVGRLAVWANDHPEIFPINYKVDRGSLIFRTGAGTKLASALGKLVALEDHFLRIVPESVTGRRFKLAAPLTWGGPLDEATRAGLE